MKHLFETFDEKMLMSEEEEYCSRKINEEFNLFLWAVLTNRIEIAKIFWRLGKVYLF